MEFSISERLPGSPIEATSSGCQNQENYTKAVHRDLSQCPHFYSQSNAYECSSVGSGWMEDLIPYLLKEEPVSQ